MGGTSLNVVGRQVYREMEMERKREKDKELWKEEEGKKERKI